MKTAKPKTRKPYVRLEPEQRRKLGSLKYLGVGPQELGRMFDVSPQTAKNIPAVKARLVIAKEA